MCILDLVPGLEYLGGASICRESHNQELSSLRAGTRILLGISS